MKIQLDYEFIIHHCESVLNIFVEKRRLVKAHTLLYVLCVTIFNSITDPTLEDAEYFLQVVTGLWSKDAGHLVGWGPNFSPMRDERACQSNLK